jgi:hypothetical protein
MIVFWFCPSKVLDIGIAGSSLNIRANAASIDKFHSRDYQCASTTSNSEMRIRRVVPVAGIVWTRCRFNPAITAKQIT